MKLALLPIALFGCALVALPAEDLFMAIREGKHARVKALIAAGADVNAPNPGGITPLLQAVITSDREMVRLLIAKGANANGAGESGVTPLHSAAFDAELTRMLLAAGANLNAATSTGHTPLGGSVMLERNEGVVEELLRAGASVNPPAAGTNTQPSILRRAVTSGNAGTVRILLDKDADVKAALPLGRIALQRGCLDCLRLLFEKGAKPTTRMVADAASPGSLEAVKLLVEAGAPVNGQDARGYTPLMRALSYNQNPALVDYLLSQGAHLVPKNETGDTALSMARRHGDTVLVAKLREAGAPDAEAVTLPQPVQDNTVPAAIERVLPLLQKIGPPVFKRRGCVTCHNNTLPVQTAAMAKRRGFKIDEDMQSREIKQISAEHRARRQALIAGTGIPEIFGYTLLALDAVGYAPDAGTDFAAHQLAFRQEPAGYWRVGDYRPPQEYSRIAATAFAIRGLQTFTPPGRAKESKERIRRARAWLLAARPHGVEEQATRLLGLGWTKSFTAKAVRDLVAAQGAGGGWAQLPGMTPDAYATGLALYALRLGGGMAPLHEVYQRGVRHLLETQRPDGSWFVQTRSYPFQPYFESGFPHGHSQWISAAGSSWATMALLLTVPEVSR